MKRNISVLAAILLVIGLTACGNNEGRAANDTAQTIQAESSQEIESADNTEEEAPQVVTSEAASNTNDEIVENTSSEATDNAEENGGVLVVYFSATGTTKGVAEKIAGITGADTYEIKAAQEYTDADLNWNDSNSPSTKDGKRFGAGATEDEIRSWIEGLQ